MSLDLRNKGTVLLLSVLSCFLSVSIKAESINFYSVNSDRD